MDVWDLNEDTKIEKYLGFGSEHDGERVEISICCRCFDNIIRECVINPVKVIHNRSVVI